MGGGEGEDGEALWKGRFQPGGEFGGGGGVGGDEFLEAALGAGAIRAGEDAANVREWQGVGSALAGGSGVSSRIENFPHG